MMYQHAKTSEEIVGIYGMEEQVLQQQERVYCINAADLKSLKCATP